MCTHTHIHAFSCARGQNYSALFLTEEKQILWVNRYHCSFHAEKDRSSLTGFIFFLVEKTVIMIGLILKPLPNSNASHFDLTKFRSPKSWVQLRLRLHRNSGVSLDGRYPAHKPWQGPKLPVGCCSYSKLKCITWSHPPSLSFQTVFLSEYYFLGNS